MGSWSLDRWIGLGGLIVGLIGVAAAVWATRVGRVESSPTFRLGAHQLIGPSNPRSPFSTTDSDLRLTYANIAVSQASKAYFVLWNGGKKTLNWATHLEEEPLKFQLPEGSVVLGNPKVVTVTRPAIHFEATADPVLQNTVQLSFSFLDRLVSRRTLRSALTTSVAAQTPEPGGRLRRDIPVAPGT